MNLDHPTSCGMHVKRYIGNGGDHAHVKFPVEPFLDDLHVEQSEETTPESKSQGSR